MIDILPTQIYSEIQDHVRRAINHAETGWEAGSDEEDTLTGDLGSSLRTGWQPWRFCDGNAWTWKISYKKFRSKGANAEENALGSDGIFQIEVQNLETGEITTKGLLFQSKKRWRGRRKNLLAQTTLMESLSRGGCAVFDYTPLGYRAVAAGDVIKSQSSPKLEDGAFVESLVDFLTVRFMGCTTGKIGLYYDAQRQILVVPNGTSGFDILRYNIKHRIKIEVKTQ